MTTTKVWPRPTAPKFVLTAKPWTWHSGDGQEQGVAVVLKPNYLVQFMTPDQAISLADALVDAAETSTTEEK
ncbi:hypothetical protein [Arthrobacter sp. NyZ413]|uniref:hypothetical protein n=1 Tax=Arthrobacter sp. NyZ413 TaxID=3144669 RepID=UPI003BF7F1CC